MSEKLLVMFFSGPVVRISTTSSASSMKIFGVRAMLKHSLFIIWFNDMRWTEKARDLRWSRYWAIWYWSLVCMQVNHPPMHLWKGVLRTIRTGRISLRLIHLVDGRNAMVSFIIPCIDAEVQWHKKIFVYRTVHRMTCVWLMWKLILGVLSRFRDIFVKLGDDMWVDETLVWLRFMLYIPPLHVAY